MIFHGIAGIIIQTEAGYGELLKWSKRRDSKFFEELAVCSAKKAHKYRVFSGSKIEYFVVLSVSSFQKFLEEMRNNIHGELSEWSKVQHSKSWSLSGSSLTGNP